MKKKKRTQEKVKSKLKVKKTLSYFLLKIKKIFKK